MSSTSGFPPQHQNQQPGSEREMNPRPIVIGQNYRGSGKLEGKVALITGGDSGIGRAVAVHFAREGADIAFLYLREDDDARDCKEMVEKEGRRCVPIRGNVQSESICFQAVQTTVEELGHLDILVNNAAEQHEEKTIEEVSESMLESTFRTNVFGMFYMIKAAFRHLKPGAAIINTASVTAYRGSEHLFTYAATKGAIVALTRSLSSALADKGIRVNGVAPGPIWTPFIPSTFDAKKVESFGKDVPLGRAGQPSEVAPCYVYLASADSSYMTGQVLHPNGGELVNG